MSHALVQVLSYFDFSGRVGQRDIQREIALLGPILSNGIRDKWPNGGQDGRDGTIR